DQVEQGEHELEQADRQHPVARPAERLDRLRRDRHAEQLGRDRGAQHEQREQRGQRAAGPDGGGHRVGGVGSQCRHRSLPLLGARVQATGCSATVSPSGIALMSMNTFSQMCPSGSSKLRPYMKPMSWFGVGSERPPAPTALSTIASTASRLSWLRHSSTCADERASGIALSVKVFQNSWTSSMTTISSDHIIAAAWSLVNCGLLVNPTAS